MRKRTDFAFNSIYNTQLAINLEIKYIQFVQNNQHGVQLQFRRKKSLLTDVNFQRFLLSASNSRFNGQEM